MRDSLELNYGVLDELFPFHISCNSQLEIVAVGPSLRRLLPADEPTGLVLGEVANVVDLFGGNNFEVLCQHHGEMVVLDICEIEKVRLRGQIWVQENLIHFLVSLRCDKPDDLNAFGLTVGDYAGHDAALEAMFLKQSYETTLSDLHDMIHRLQEAAAEKERYLAVESGLTQDLNAAGDLRIRACADGLISDLWVANEEQLRRPIAEYLGTSLEASFGDAWKEIQGCREELDEGATVPINFSFLCRHTVRQFESRVAINADGNYLLLGRDVTARRRLEARLEEAALHDPLTGLANRRLFNRSGEEVVTAGGEFAILLIDVNDFKTINDTHGHQVGDELLCEISNRIIDKLRVGDTAARLGGDEFGILLRGPLTQVYAVDFAVGLESWIARPLNSEDVELTPRVSVGVAMSHEGQSLDDVLRDADFAMYTAKRDSTQNIKFCNGKLLEAMRERNATKRSLQRSNLEEEFVPYYQPIIDLKTGKVTAVEALVRWRHPWRGLLTPAFFLEIAEEVGLLKEIGYSVLANACSQIQNMREVFNEDSLCVNVNLCKQQAVDENLWEEVQSVLERTDLEARYLSLEITESALIDDFAKAKKIFSTLRQHGVGVALDDFGVGYSSLSYLQEFPITSLKIDRSLVRHICENQKQRDVFACVHQLGVTLGMSIVAEGVETKEQARVIRELGCEHAQGFLFAKPMSFEDLMENWDKLTFTNQFFQTDHAVAEDRQLI